MTVLFERTTLGIDEVKQLTVSDIVEDPNSGGFVRIISVLTATSGNVPVVELRLSAMEKAKLEITTPPQEF